ncbi:MAG: hypothetical protein E6344_12770 [Clostridium sp.]|nr:hypothetical protein [Clostridium sp.]MDU7084565.1 hypothetical protein [Clostridium sp.]
MKVSKVPLYLYYKVGINFIEGEEMTNASYGSNTTSNTSAGNSDYIKMSENDRVAIELLKILLNGNIISFISDILSIQATTNGIKAIYKKYTNSGERIYNPDALAVYSIYAAICARVIITYVGYRKFQLAYKSVMSGDNTVNIDNFIKINFVNAVFLFGGLIALGVSENIYENGRLNIFV